MLIGSTAVNSEVSAQVVCKHFLGWQCRLRQLGIRQGGGRPTSGMRPTVMIPGRSGTLGQITVLIVKRESQEYTAQFRHMVLKTQDPAERYASALKFLAAAYYQQPEGFSEEMTALFAVDSAFAAGLLQAKHCVLNFEQYSQRYLIPCSVRELAKEEPAFQATYWHNRLFNSSLPGDIRMLGFQPDWASVEMDPAIS